MTGPSLPEQEAAARLAAIVDSSEDAILSTTLQGIITSWNGAAQRLYGYAAHEALGQHVTLIIPAERRFEAEVVLARIRAGEHVAHFETVRQAKDGRQIPISLAVSPIKGPEGAVIGSSKISRDITEQKRVVNALRASEERFRALAEHAPVGIVQCDEQGQCHYVNQTWVQLAGLTAEQAAGSGWLCAVHPEDRERVEREWRQGIQGTPPFESEYRLLHPDGSTRWIQGRVAELRDGEHRTGFIVTSADVSERKQVAEALRTSELIYRGIGESIRYGVWICDLQGRNVYTSPSMLELLGMTQEQCSEFGWSSSLHPDEAQETVAAWKECVHSGTFWEREHRFRGHDGGWHHILARGVPIRDERGSILWWAGINLDITPRVAAEEALREADRRKDEFLATLAHELRNPLAPIRSALEILRIAEPGSPVTVRARSMMERQVDQMVRLVDDLLEISRITRGKIALRPQPVPLETVIAAAVETSRPLIEAAGHELQLELPAEPLILQVDPVRIGQVISNLLNNASRYTDDGGRIRVSAQRCGDRIAIRVEDNGIGIAPELVPHVFEMFTQGDRHPRRGQSGLGIGLTLARGIVEMHGGEIEVISAGPGRGSCFSVYLPAPAPAASDSAAEPPAGPAQTESQPRGYRILVVDDNVDAAQSLAMLLRMLGHAVDVEHEGLAAIERALACPPDLAILDISLPGIDGYEIARRLRKQPALEATRIAALTGHGQEEHRRRSREAGIDHHLLKPVDLPLLQSLLQGLGDRPLE